MSKSNVICGAKNILAISMSLMLRNYFFITVKDQLGVSFREVPRMCFKRQYLSQNHTEGEIFCAMWAYFQLNPIPNFMSGS